MPFKRVNCGYSGWRLQNKLLVGILLAQLILMATVILIVEQQLRRSVLDEFRKHGLSVARSLAAVNSDFVSTYNYVKIDQHLQQSLQEPDLLYAAVMLFDGEVASYVERKPLRNQVLTGTLHETSLNATDPLIQYDTHDNLLFCDVTMPIITDGTRWGTVRIGFSLDSLHSAIAEMRRSLFALGGVGLLLGYFASMLLARRITQPIKTLVGNVQAMAAGRYDQPIVVNSNDEIGFLGQRFASMQAIVKRQIGLLAEANAELSSSNRELHHEVAERQKNERALQHEIARRHKKESELLASKARLANAQRIARLGYWEWHANDNRIFWSEELADLLNLERQSRCGHYRALYRSIDSAGRAALSSAIRAASHGGHRQSIEHRVKGRDGKQHSVQHEIEADFDNDGAARKVVGTLQDITERKNAERRIRYLAHFDSVTGLPNRLHLEDLLRLWLERSTRNQQQIAVMFLDIDHFKRINDTLGHSAGDDLLRQVAERLSTSVRGGDSLLRSSTSHLENSVARLGGDEFVIVLDGIKGANDAASVAQRIQREFALPFPLSNTEVVVTPSIGISCSPADGADPETLLKHADMAMYHAKDQGRNNFQFFAASMNTQLQERLLLEGHLRESLEHGHFHLVYQAKIDARDGAITGMEALLRWAHPQLGPVPPAKFIPIAEETGLIAPIGEWVLRDACAQASDWQRMGLPPLCVAVNLSAAQFRQESLAETISRILRETGLPAARLELELTESMLMEQVESSITRLEELKAIGVSLSVDDFGTGYSSLSYLKRFPIDTLKIDQSFIRDITSSTNDATIVSATIGLGHNLKLNVVAEGVEDAAQYAFLRSHGCDQMQGYFISKPLPADEFAAFIRHRPRDVGAADRQVGSLSA